MRNREIIIFNFNAYLNDILLDSLLSLAHDSKFLGTSRSAGVLKI